MLSTICVIDSFSCYLSPVRAPRGARRALGTVVKQAESEGEAQPRQRLIWEREDYEAHGLHRLRGTVRYPKPCMLHREAPPVSRVRGIRMHGLKGGGGNRIA